MVVKIRITEISRRFQRTGIGRSPSNRHADYNKPPSLDQEIIMSIKTKIAALAVAALAVTGSIASTATPAAAHGFHPGWGLGAGLVGAAVVGSAIAASNPYPYGYQHCGWVRQFDGFGHYVGTVRSCY
jgi:hypothetical protein